MKKLLFVACSWLVFTMLPAHAGDADKDLKALQGTWMGKVRGLDELELKITGNKWTLRATAKADFSFAGNLTLDTKAKPAAMDMKVTGGEGKEAERHKDKTSVAIYEVTGDKLRWCANEPGKDDRPTAFSEKGEGEKRYLLVEFQRAK